LIASCSGILQFDLATKKMNTLMKSGGACIRSLWKYGDYIFLGSSRVENDIVPDLIEAKTGKKAVNLGFQASKLADVYFVLQLLDEYQIKYKKVFIQVDYIFNLEKAYSNVLGYEILPFINENESISKHCQLNDSANFWANKNIPFYRYGFTSQKNGMREIILNLLKKKTKTSVNKGFEPLEGSFSDGKYNLPEKINQTID